MLHGDHDIPQAGELLVVRGVKGAAAAVAGAEDHYFGWLVPMGERNGGVKVAVCVDAVDGVWREAILGFG